MGVDLRLICAEIDKNPDLAALCIYNKKVPHDLQLRWKEAPAVRGGFRDGREHIWRVEINIFDPRFRVSSTPKDPDAEEVEPRKVGNTTIVQHKRKVFVSEQYHGSRRDGEIVLLLAYRLFHELLHLRIIIERDSNWRVEHSATFRAFEEFLKIAKSAPGAEDVRRQLVVMIRSAMGANADKDQVRRQVDDKYEFLVHEKFDIETTTTALGISPTVAASLRPDLSDTSNAGITDRYCDEVARRIAEDAGHPSVTESSMWRDSIKDLKGFVVALYDKADQLQQIKIGPGPAKGLHLLGPEQLQLDEKLKQMLGELEQQYTHSRVTQPEHVEHFGSFGHTPPVALQPMKIPVTHSWSRPPSIPHMNVPHMITPPHPWNPGISHTAATLPSHMIGHEHDSGPFIRPMHPPSTGISAHGRPPPGGMGIPRPPPLPQASRPPRFQTWKATEGVVTGRPRRIQIEHGPASFL